MYLKDVNSANAFTYLERTKPRLFLSILTQVEFFNAAERRIFSKHLQRTTADSAYAAFRDDVERGVLRVLDIEPTIWDRTERLILQNTAAVGCGTADVVHIAAALLLQADSILTFDLRQRELAKRVNLQMN